MSADSQDFAAFQGRARRLALPLLFRSTWPQPIKTNARIAQGPDAAVARKLEAELPLQIVDQPRGIPNADSEMLRVDDLPLKPPCVSGHDAPCRGMMIGADGPS